MKKKERIRILEQEVERLKIQYATLLAEVNRLRWPDKPAFPAPPTSPPYTPTWEWNPNRIWSQANSETIADEARSDA
jgi:hypothetical protein